MMTQLRALMSLRYSDSKGKFRVELRKNYGGPSMTDYCGRLISFYRSSISIQVIVLGCIFATACTSEHQAVDPSSTLPPGHESVDKGPRLQDIVVHKAVRSRDDIYFGLAAALGINPRDTSTRGEFTNARYTDRFRDVKDNISGSNEMVNFSQASILNTMSLTLTACDVAMRRTRSDSEFTSPVYMGVDMGERFEDIPRENWLAMIEGALKVGLQTNNVPTEDLDAAVALFDQLSDGLETNQVSTTRRLGVSMCIYALTNSKFLTI